MLSITKLPKVKGQYRQNVLLSKTNWFNVGGAADILYKPYDTDDLSFFIKNLPKNISYTVIGCGSNLIIRDGGIAGVTIKLGGTFNYISCDNTIITVGAGCLSYNLAIFAMNNNIGGFEFLSGIPGTVGGNLAMNAGAYGSDIANVIIDVTIIDDEGNIHTFTSKDIGYVYRGNNLPENWIFVEARMQGYVEEVGKIKQRIDDIDQKRKKTQPIKEKTSGSSFKNLANHKAWQLIDQAGCRGLRMGGAVVSDMHCNFIINDNNATARDIEDLGEEVRRRVREKFNIELEWEIKRIGRFTTL